MSISTTTHDQTASPSSTGIIQDQTVETRYNGSDIVSNKEKTMNWIPFDEIYSGASIRCVSIDSILFISVRDIIMCVCGTEYTTANTCWARIKKTHMEELTEDLDEHQFPGAGQRIIPIITVQGGMKLIMMLPGKRAKAMRVQASDILARYVMGNDSLIHEIRKNKQMGPAKACATLLEKACLYTELPQAVYLYATKSDAFPGLIKIGRSSEIAASLSCLNTGCAPAPHYTVAVVPTFDAIQDKAWAFEFFSHARVEGDFFSVSEQEVKAFFNTQIMHKYQMQLSENISNAQGGL